ncbi:YqjF family protein [Planococcus rifietoensis]|uniref:YqjF family protein n=1 Tax=Planococcus rifietoensis TaxID=200991 RepID=UPI0038503213
MKKPWIMAQTWRDLVFLHWPIAPDALRPFVPAELEIDLFEGRAWFGVVPFIADHTRLRFSLPFPIVGSYRELNVRTYVKYKGRSGVYFFSLDADSLLAVKAASAGGFLPYRYAGMKVVKKDRRYVFTSRLAKPAIGESFRMGFTPSAGILESSELERWLTERYCLWTKPKSALYRVDIVHAPWQLQKVHAEIAENSLAAFLPVGWNAEEPLAHFSALQKTRFYPPVKETI